MIMDPVHLLEVRNLTIDFATDNSIVHAVNDVSWHVDAGETLAILGESGSGKSVTASVIMDLLPAPPMMIRGGRIMFEGQDLLQLDGAKRRKINGSGLAMVFQDPLAALNPVYPVGWQIGEPLKSLGLGRQEIRRRVLELMHRVGIKSPEARIDHYPHQFSGGQRQRAVIAMALARGPKVLIADEPTTALDVTVQDKILRLIRELRDQDGMGVVLITHDLGVVAQHSDRVVVMRYGQIVEAGPTQEVLSNPSHEYTRKLLAALPGNAMKIREANTSEALLEVRSLRKSFALSSGLFSRKKVEMIHALDDVSLTVRCGEAVAIVGESGSGKSTLANVLLGLLKHDGGSALLDGQSIVSQTDAARTVISRRMQAVFQDPAASLNPRLKIADIIAEPWKIHRGVLAKEKWSDRISELLGEVDLPENFKDRYPDQLSGGQKQRVAIARALALTPQLIICDEAVSALDASVQSQIMALLKRLAEKQNLAYLFITHDLNVVKDFADRVVVMQKGRIVEDGFTSQIFERPVHEYTKKLIGSIPDFHGLVAQLPAGLDRPSHLTN